MTVVEVTAVGMMVVYSAAQPDASILAQIAIRRITASSCALGMMVMAFLRQTYLILKTNNLSTVLAHLTIHVGALF